MKRALCWLAVAALALTACSAAPRRPASAPSSTTVAATSTTTTQPEPSDDLAWERATGAALNLGGGAASTISALIPAQLNEAWRAFGTRFSSNGLPAATQWTSPNAETWTAAPLFPGSNATQANGAAEFRGTTVVVGSAGSGADQQAMAAYSRPGTPFAMAQVPAGSGPSTMQEVTSGSLGLVATGTVGGHFALWASTDGRTWTEVPAAEKVISAEPGATVDALLSVGDAIYAAGSVQPGATPQAAVWSTTDGLDWTRVTSASTSFAGAYGEKIYSLATFAGGRGLVAVGAIDGGSGWEPASWISPNGSSWSLPSTDFPAKFQVPSGTTDLGPAGGSAALAVSAIPTLDDSVSLVASGGGPYGQAAWSSTDGLHWSALAMPAQYSGAGSWSAGLIAASGTTTVVADPQPGQPYLLSDIAGSWGEPSAATFGPVRPIAAPVAIHRIPGGMVLTVELVIRTQTIGAPSVTVANLISSDGRSWRPATAAEMALVQPAREPSPGALSVSTGTGWLAVSTGNDRVPVVYQSTDGRTWSVVTTLAAPFSVASTATTVSPTRTSTGSASVTLPPRGEAPGYSVDGLCDLPEPTPSDSTLTSPAATTEVAVGSGQYVPSTSPGPTTAAAAWHTTGGRWSLASVDESLPDGSGQDMTGCLEAGGALYSYGVAVDDSGAPEPAIWRSSDGSSWSRQTNSTFDASAPAPLESVAADGRSWLAVATPDPQANPFQPGIFGAAGPGSAILSDAAFGPAPSTANGEVGLWVSTDAGGTWLPVDTAQAPWLSDQVTDLDLVGFGGSGTPYVVGTVDGRLAVWDATAAAAAPSSP